jgi:hypothetical protein
MHKIPNLEHPALIVIEGVSHRTTSTGDQSQSLVKVALSELGALIGTDSGNEPEQKRAE